ncbi:MAG: phosphatidylglycerophosphatase A family protein [Terriglobales bacterium]
MEDSVSPQPLEAPAAGAPRSQWAWQVATVSGMGRLQPGAGTWASGMAVAAWWAAAQFIPGAWHGPALGLLTLASIAAGIVTSGIVARESGNQDPSVVVVDEVAGQWTALIAVPLDWKYLLLSFILFRCYDIGKPPPLRRLEAWHGGPGIVLDDVAAGIYARLTLALLMYLGFPA